MTSFILVVWIGRSLAALGPGYATEAECWAAEPAVVEDLRRGEPERADNPAVVSSCLPEGFVGDALWRALDGLDEAVREPGREV